MSRLGLGLGSPFSPAHCALVLFRAQSTESASLRKPGLPQEAPEAVLGAAAFLAAKKLI